MQINDLFGRAAAFETARLPDGTAAVLPAEHAAALYVNEQPAFRVVCTPELLPQLALGRLLTEGWINSADEVERVAVCAHGLKKSVQQRYRETRYMISDGITISSSSPSSGSSLAATANLSTFHCKWSFKNFIDSSSSAMSRSICSL